MTQPLIVLDDVCKQFSAAGPFGRLARRGRSPGREVLSGVSLAVAPGEFLGLLGPNGAGKTTVLKIIATLLRPDAGSVRVCGVDALRQERRARAATGFVLADERSFHWRLTASENLEFFAALNSLRPAAARARVRHLLDRLDLLDMADRHFGELSAGMKQRLAVARALLARPRVLLMDEPTRSIDAAHAEQVWRLVREEIDAAGGCLVLVTHQIQEALSLCGRIALLSEGRITVDTSATSLGAFTADLDGFTLSVRGLAARDLHALQCFPGVRNIRVASQVAGEQVLEVWTMNGDLPLAGFIGELTGMGATICSLQRATPLQGVIERLATAKVPRSEVHA